MTARVTLLTAISMEYAKPISLVMGSMETAGGEEPALVVFEVVELEVVDDAPAEGCVLPARTTCSCSNTTFPPRPPRERSLAVALA